MALPSQLAAAARNVQAQQNRIRAQRVQLYDQKGTFEVTMASDYCEFAVNLNFVNTFIERPIFHPGLEVGTNQEIVAGYYPDYSIFVLGWATDGSDATLVYKGVRLGVKIGGPGLKGKKFEVHYSFKGRALSFPAGVSPSNGTGIA